MPGARSACPRPSAASSDISLHSPSSRSKGLVRASSWVEPGRRRAPWRAADDLDLALRLLAGPEGREAKGYRLDLPPPRHDRLRDYRVFVLTEHPTATADGEVVAAVDDLVARLERSGTSVRRQSELLPSLAESQSLVERFSELGKAAFARSDAPASKETIRDYFECLTAQEVLRRKWDRFFEAFDVVVAPCYSVPAFPHFTEPDPWPGLNRTLRINGADIAYAPQHAWPLIAGMPHLPATAAPIGRTRPGLPIGAQYIGPFLEDLTTIAFAGQLSAEFALTAEIAVPAQ